MPALMSLPQSIESYVARRNIQVRRLRSIFAWGSESRRLVGELLGKLAAVTPEPEENYERWVLPRAAKTVEILRRWLRPGQVAMDIASGANIAYLLSASLPEVDWLTTGMTGEEVEFRSVADGSLAYTFRPQPFLLKEGRSALPYDGPLDAVTMFEVVEHLPFNPSELFGSIGESLRPGGLFIISTPNITSRTAILRLLGGSTPHQTPLLDSCNWYHKKEYAPWELKQLLEWAGFRVEAITTANCYMDDPQSWRAMVHHAAMLVAAGFSASPVEVRNLIRYSGSTQFVVARKVGECDWSKPKYMV